MCKQRVKVLVASALLLVTMSAPVAFAADSITVKVPDWVSRIKLGGDMRLRYQGDLYDRENIEYYDPSEGTYENTNDDRHRFRYRVRLDGSAKLAEKSGFHGGTLDAYVRLASGNTKDPVSTNDTLGDYQNKDDICIDRAYLKGTYQGADFLGMPFPKLTAQGGRTPNPWFGGSGLIWDTDLNFEGGAVKVETDGRELNPWNVFFTLGAFPIEEVDQYKSAVGEDKWLYGAQAGVEVTPMNRLKGTLGVAYFNYENIKGEPSSGSTVKIADNYTDPQYRQQGNTLYDINQTGSGTSVFALASDYDLFAVSAKLILNPYSPVSVSLVGDMVTNVGFDRDEIEKEIGSSVQEDTLGYQMGLEYGYSEVRAYGQWAGSLYYRYLESDAVLDAFCDSDFHNGGTNAKGWIMAFDFGLLKNTWLTVKYATADEIDIDDSYYYSSDLVQLDINAKF